MRVAFVIYDGFQVLDLAGPHEVFQDTGQYECLVVAPEAGPVTASGGLPVHAGFGVDDLEPAGVDTLVVVGGTGVDRAREDAALVGWVAKAAKGARRVATVCSGALLLAEAGLLDGRRVTTHWRREEQLRREFPGLRVDCDPIFVRDGRVWTSAGVTAGMDLALALVEDDHGRDVAHAVARELVMFLRRPGSQSQFSVPLWSAQPATDPIRVAVSSVQADPGARHTIADLAGRSGLSARHLQRRFTAELGVPPAAYVERVRVEAARRALAEGDEPVETLARRLGFGTGETLRRAFHRHVGVTPSDYRDRFRGTEELQMNRIRMTTYGLLVFEEAEELDFVGPWEVFTASALIRGGADKAVLVAEQAGPVRCNKGMRVLPDHVLDDHPKLDVLLVPGGRGASEVQPSNPVVTGWISKVAEQADWVTSVCTGAILLYAAGPAKGRRVATHWSAENDLEARGDVTVVRNARYVVDGNVVTSQGVSAGIDMALWLVGRIHGRDHARSVRHYIQYEPAPPYLADEPM